MDLLLGVKTKVPLSTHTHTGTHMCVQLAPVLIE